MTPARRRRLAPILVTAACCLAIWTRSTRAADSPSPDGLHVHDFADSLFRRGKSDSALTILPPAIASARAAGDRPLLLKLRVMEGRIAVLAGHSRDAESGLREALSLAEALGDSAGVARAVRWLVGSLSDQGRTADTVPLCHRLLELSPRIGDRQYAGQGWMGLAYHDLLSGRPREAKTGYEKAIAEFQAVEQPYWELWSLAGLGRAFGGLNDFRAERDCYARMASRAGELNLLTLEATALNNIGTWEFIHGDPGVAADNFRKACDVHRATGSLRESVIALRNLAVVETNLGWYDAASATMDTVRAICREQGYRSEVAAALEQLGSIKNLQKRYAEAAALFRQALSEALSKESVEAAIGLSQALAGMDSAEAGLAILKEYRPLAERDLKETRILLDLELGERLVELRRWDEALTHLLRVDREAERLLMNEWRLRPLTLAARCYSSTNRPDSALVLIQRAEAMWERGRGLPVDPEWREILGSRARDLFALLIELTLDSGGRPVEGASAGRAFDDLQRFKARTLQERMRGPEVAAGDVDRPGPITLAETQATLLRDDEILIDTFIGGERSFLFAVTRTGIRAVPLEGGDVSLASRLTLHREILSAPRSGNATEPLRPALEKTNEVLGRLLLGPIADLARSHHRVVFVPDGEFNLVPLGWLPLPPETVGGTWEPLALGREITFVPSAGVLAECRRRAASTGASGRILAFAGRAGRGDEPLPGAVREVEWLADRFSLVDVRVDSLGKELGNYRVLHLAAHAFVDNQRPWRSGILVIPDRFAIGDGYLRASSISRLQLQARLAVLSACESAGGRILSGEGVLGLTGAFLAAGVPSVVATLWPVDDRVTETFTRRFYESLIRGKGPAAAVRDAQLSLRADLSTGDPFYWAAFVVVGDGSDPVPLTPRAGFPWAYVPVGLALLAGVLLGLRARRRPPR